MLYAAGIEANSESEAADTPAKQNPKPKAA